MDELRRHAPVLDLVAPGESKAAEGGGDGNNGGNGGNGGSGEDGEGDDFSLEDAEQALQGNGSPSGHPEIRYDDPMKLLKTVGGGIKSAWMTWRKAKRPLEGLINLDYARAELEVRWGGRQEWIKAHKGEGEIHHSIPLIHPLYTCITICTTYVHPLYIYIHHIHSQVTI